jgi:hypothetical protein
VIVPLAIIAALDECMTGVDMDVVQKYRTQFLNARAFRDGIIKVPTHFPPPIKLRKKNRHSFYFLEDGHHRTMGALLDRRSRIDAELVDGDPVELSWRWPRIAPVLLFGSLLNDCGVPR